MFRTCANVCWWPKAVICTVSLPAKPETWSIVNDSSGRVVADAAALEAGLAPRARGPMFRYRSAGAELVAVHTELPSIVLLPAPAR